MKMNLRTRSTTVCFVSLAIVFGGLIWSLLAKADPSTNRLIELLINAKSHRVRSQAAYSLSRFTSASSKDALLTGLMDPHAAVRTAVLSSLVKVGDQSTISILRASSDNNRVVNDQIRRTVVLLEEKYPNARLPVNWTQITKVIEIGNLYDRTHCGRKTIAKKLRQYFARHIRIQQGFAVAEPPQGLNGITPLIKRHRIKAYFITGSLSSLTKMRAGREITWKATISVTMLDYPGKSIRATLNNHAEIRRLSKFYKPDQDHGMQDIAIEESIRTTIDQLARAKKTY